MPITFHDRLTLDKPRRTEAGFLAVRARAARSGYYAYAGHEIDPNNVHGLRDKPVVNVLRDDDTVFDRAALQGFIGKPVTDDHPDEPVTADNWKKYARGTIMGAIRDGEYLAFDLLLTDAALIRSIEGGKRQLSNAYSADIEVGRFVAADGTVCEARQSKITSPNHCAVVQEGRAGPLCRIGDAAMNGGQDKVAAARRAWLSDKENAHRVERSAGGSEEVAAMAPPSFADARDGVGAARRQWLADKESAHRGQQ